MESWPVPPLPRLAGVGRAPLIHDTATGAPQVSATGPHARMYVCGITPYDATHMGHAATYVAFDLLQRAWRDAGLQVTYVQNVTDVDDPLLERAQMLGQDWREIAARETALFRDDMAALRVIPPDHYLGVTESLHLIEELIGRLQAAGAAYAVDDDLYFPVAADPGFGSVSGLDRAAMTAVFAERGGDPDRRGKADPLDALLWQAARPEEPAWESSLGHGRPGWHVECTAIALHHLGMEFDVQGGGSDLAFPHHEMSASQAVAAHGGGEFARRYVHAGMVGLDGEKMSKSRGNLVFVSALRAAGHDPMALRLALLDHHYRSDWEWTPAGLTAAEERLARWRAAFAAATGAAAEPLIAAVRAALADDLDAPRALAVVDDWAATGGDEAAAPAAVADAVDALLGVR